MRCSLSSFLVPKTNHAVLSCLSWVEMVWDFCWLSSVSVVTLVLRLVMVSSSSAMWMSLVLSSARSCSSCWSFSSSCFTISSMVDLSWSPFTELSRTCWRSLLMRSRLAFILLAMNFMFSRICWALSARSPSLAIVTRFSASVISRKPCWIWLSVDIMSLISLSFWSMIFSKESICVDSAVKACERCSSLHPVATSIINAAAT